MIPSNLTKAIENSDLNMAKAIVIRQLNADRLLEHPLTLYWAREAEIRFKEKGIEFFQEDDQLATLIEDRTQWDKYYWNTLRSDFKFNYSEVKLKNIIEVMEHLRSQGHPDFQVEADVKDENPSKPVVFSEPKQEQTYSSETKERNNRDYYIGGGAGAILGGVGGKLLGFGVGGVMVGVAVGVAVVYFKNNRG